MSGQPNECSVIMKCRDLPTEWALMYLSYVWQRFGNNPVHFVGRGYTALTTFWHGGSNRCDRVTYWTSKGRCHLCRDLLTCYRGYSLCILSLREPYSDLLYTGYYACIAIVKISRYCWCMMLVAWYLDDDAGIDIEHYNTGEKCVEDS